MSNRRTPPKKAPVKKATTKKATTKKATTKKAPAKKAAAKKATTKKTPAKKAPAKKAPAKKASVKKAAAGIRGFRQPASLGVAARPARPSRATIKPQVRDVIDAEAGRNGAPAHMREALRAGAEQLVLERDLNINGTRRAALSVDYTRISTSYQGGLPVTAPAAVAAITVGAAIDLVHSKANGN